MGRLGEQTRDGCGKGTESGSGSAVLIRLRGRDPFLGAVLNW
jgi:hypothetical protein